MANFKVILVLAMVMTAQTTFANYGDSEVVGSSDAYDTAPAALSVKKAGRTIPSRLMDKQVAGLDTIFVMERGGTIWDDPIDSFTLNSQDNISRYHALKAAGYSVFVVPAK